jgi:hypothetical protein
VNHRLRPGTKAGWFLGVRRTALGGLQADSVLRADEPLHGSWVAAIALLSKHGVQRRGTKGRSNVSQAYLSRLAQRARPRPKGIVARLIIVPDVNMPFERCPFPNSAGSILFVASGSALRISISAIVLATRLTPTPASTMAPSSVPSRISTAQDGFGSLYGPAMDGV